MKNIARELILSLFLLLSGCATHYYAPPKPALIVIKSPALKFADMGFLYRGKKWVKVEVYASGHALFTLKVGKRICVDGKCMNESDFYKRYFGAQYPPGTLLAIFSRQPIFDNEGLLKANGKNIQRIFKEDRFDIIYTFDDTSVRFKDKINHILIKIKER
ncbi:hypothetical protein [Hydrogenimonas sp.]